MERHLLGYSIKQFCFYSTEHVDSFFDNTHDLVRKVFVSKEASDKLDHFVLQRHSEVRGVASFASLSFAAFDDIIQIEGKTGGTDLQHELLHVASVTVLRKHTAHQFILRVHNLSFTQRHYVLK